MVKKIEIFVEGYYYCTVGEKANTNTLKEAKALFIERYNGVSVKPFSSEDRLVIGPHNVEACFSQK